MNTLKKTVKYVKDHKWASLLFEATIIVLVLVIFSWVQSRGTLAADGELAPDFVLQSTDGKTVQLSNLRGKKVLVYFSLPGAAFVT